MSRWHLACISVLCAPIRPGAARLAVVGLVAATPLVLGLAQAPTTDPDKLPISIAPYDVASIRISHSTSGNEHITTGNGSLLAENATLKLLIRFAYYLPDKLLVGGPTWINETKFDIRAKTDDASSIDGMKLSEKQLQTFLAQKQIPLQKLLEDRFQLKMHREDRVMPFYALVVAKSGLKIKPSDDKSDIEQVRGAGLGVVLDAPGLKITGRDSAIAVKVTLDQLARFLIERAGGDLDRPVVNKTGLNGPYDFKLQWTPDNGPQDSDVPSLFTAIQEQLGLKLESQKGPVEVTVIDYAELPSEN